MKKEGNIFAVLVNWKDDGTSIVCGICNEFFDFRKIYSLTPKNNEGEKALNNF